jgi:hypothetical protein
MPDYSLPTCKSEMELCKTIEYLLGNKNCGTALQFDDNTKVILQQTSGVIGAY